MEVLRNNYVYILCDPRKLKYNLSLINIQLPGKPFYIGRGRGGRKEVHVKGVLKNLEDEEYFKCENSFKKRKIRNILRTGKEPIIFVIKENILFKESCQLERFLIKYIGRYDLRKGPLTNLTDGGEGSEGLIRTESSKELTRKPVVQLNLSGEVIKIFNSITEADENTLSSMSMIVPICKKQGNNKISFGHTWCYLKDLKERQRELKENPIKIFYEHKKIIQLSLKGEFIKEWDTATSAANSLKLHNTSIRNVLIGESKSSGGFYWCYPEDKDLAQQRLKINPVRGTSHRSVCQFSLNGEFIKQYKNIEEVSKLINSINSANISSVCKGKLKTCCDFGWCYLENKETYQNKLKENPLTVGIRRSVFQYDLNGNFLKEWKSLNFAEKITGISRNRISYCCEGITERTDNYIWKYK
jgi:hypothetical protein